MALALSPGALENDNPRIISEEHLKLWGFDVVPSAESVVLRGLEFQNRRISRILTLCTRTGADIGFLQQNGLNNKGDVSYTFWNSKGDRFILPAAIGVDDSVKYDLGRLEAGGSDDGDVSEKHIRLHLSGHEVKVEDLGEETGTIYRLDELDTNFTDNYCKIPTGKDGILEGMVGNRKVVIYSAREIGKVGSSKGYHFVNEDNAGYNPDTNRVVISDGVGGSLFGELASAMAVSRIKDALGVGLDEAVKSLYLSYLKLNRYISSPKYNYLQRSNAVFAAIELTGNRLDVATAGDTVITVIRNGTVIYVSPKRNTNYNKVLLGEMTEAEYYSDPNLYSADFIASCLSTLNRGFDTERVYLQKGDIVLGRTDGMDVRSDYQLCKMIGGMTDPHLIIECLVNDVAAVNNNGAYCREYEDNGVKNTVHNITAPSDNGTGFALVY